MDLDIPLLDHSTELEDEDEQVVLDEHGDTACNLTLTWEGESGGGHTTLLVSLPIVP